MPISKTAASNNDDTDQGQVSRQPNYSDIMGTDVASNGHKESIYSWDSQMDIDLAQLCSTTAEQQKPSGGGATSYTAMPRSPSEISSSIATPTSSGPASPGPVSPGLASPSSVSPSLDPPALVDIEPQQAILREANLIYHKVIGACACLDCVKVLFCSEVVQHLKDTHQYPLSTTKVIQEVLLTLPGLRQSRKEKRKYRLPKTVIPALEGILVEQGYHCQYCSAAFRTSNPMKKHLRNNHPEGHKKWMGKQLPKGPMQSLSSPSRTGGVFRATSFQVTVGEGMPVRMACVPGPMLDEALEDEAKDVNGQLKEMEAKYQEGLTINIRDPTSVDPWLMRMEWSSFLKEVPLKEWYEVTTMKRWNNWLHSGDQNGGSEILRAATHSLLLQAICTTKSVNRLNLVKLNNPDKANHQGAKVRMVQDSTSNRYFDTWADYLFFVMSTTQDPQAISKFNLHLTQRQQLCVKKIRRSLDILNAKQAEAQRTPGKRKKVGGSTEADMENQQLKENILDFSYLSLDVEILEEPFQSSLVAFTAASAVMQDRRNGDIKTYTLARPRQHTSLLAAIRFCARLIVVEEMDRVSKANHPDARDEYLRARLQGIQESCERFMMVDSPSPMGEIQCRLSYAFAAASLERLDENIAWLNDDTLTLSAGQVNFAAFKKAVQTYIKETREFLLQNLLFTDQTHLPSREAITRIKDDITTLECGYWYGKLDQKSLNPTFDTVRQSVIGHTDRTIRDLYVYTTQNGGKHKIHWKLEGHQEYEHNCQKLLDRIMLLIHLTAGSPARGTEITSIRWRNTAQVSRNILIINGEVVIRTQYHKSLNLMQKSRFISRVLPHTVGRMVVAYLSWIQPFRAFLQVKLAPALAQQQIYFLWSKGLHPPKPSIMDEDPASLPDIEHHFSPAYLSEKLKTWTRKALGTELGIAAYRHVAVAISQKKIQEPLEKAETARVEKLLAALSILDEDSHDGKSSEQLAEVEGLVNSIFEEQFGHTPATAEAHYARGAKAWDAPSQRNLEVFRLASRAWHNLLELDQIDAVVGPDRFTDQLQIDGPAISSTSETWPTGVETFPTDHPLITTPEMRELMCKINSTTNPAFKSVAQARCYFAMEELKKEKKSIVLVMATGAGKTFPVFLSAQAKDSNTTVVILPFVALADDFFKRCKEAGIECERWTPNIGYRPTVIIVSAETIAKNSKFAQDLHRWTSPKEEKLVDRIVFDESQVMITAFYRDLDAIAEVLPKIDCQKVFLTATLPPAGEPLFLARCGLSGVTMVREPTSRPNLCYRTIPLGKREVRAGGLNNIYSTVIESVLAKSKEILPGEKIVVYCPTKSQTQELASLLGCEYYHSDRPRDEKSKIFGRWRDHDTYKIIVATFEGLGVGIDLPNIRYTFHHGRPSNIALASQEFGRAGRDGRPATCFVFYEAEVRTHKKRETVANAAKRSGNATLKPDTAVAKEQLAIASTAALEAFFDEDRCIRVAMTEFLDICTVDCAVVGGEKCSRCDLEKIPSTEAIHPLGDKDYMPPMWYNDRKGCQITLTQMQRESHGRQKEVTCIMLSSSPLPDTDMGLSGYPADLPEDDSGSDTEPRAAPETQTLDSGDVSKDYSQQSVSLHNNRVNAISDSHTMGVGVRDSCPGTAFPSIPEFGSASVFSSLDWTMIDGVLDPPDVAMEIPDSEFEQLMEMAQGQSTNEGETSARQNALVTGKATTKIQSLNTYSSSGSSSSAFGTLPPPPNRQHRQHMVKAQVQPKLSTATTHSNHLRHRSPLADPNTSLLYSPPEIQVPRSTVGLSWTTTEHSTADRDFYTPITSSPPMITTATTRNELFEQWNSLISPYSQRCVLCHKLGHPNTHTWAGKKDAERRGDCDTAITFMDFLQWKKRLLPLGAGDEFPRYSCCYRCYLPFDFCKQLKDGQPCGAGSATSDIVLPIIMLSLIFEDLHPTQEEILHPTEENEFMKWLRGGCKVMGVKTTNCFMYFTFVAKRLSQGV